MFDEDEEVSYTVSNPTYNNILDLKEVTPIVFRSFIYRLTIDTYNDNYQQMMANILGCDKVDIRQSIMSLDKPENFKVYLCKSLPDINNTVKLKWSNVAGDNDDNIISCLGTLNDINEVTVNKDTYEVTDMNRYRLYDVPASAYIFSKANADSYNNSIKLDWNFSYATENTTMTNIMNLQPPKQVVGFDLDYWITNYNFESIYDDVEYKMNNIPTNDYSLPETVAILSASDGSYKIRRNANMVAGILIAYNTLNINNIKAYNPEVSKNDEEKMTNKNTFPMVYYNLHNAIKTMDGKIKIVWNTQGILSVMSKI